MPAGLAAVRRQVGDALLGVPLQRVGLLPHRVADVLDNEGLGVGRQLLYVRHRSAIASVPKVNVGFNFAQCFILDAMTTMKL